MKHTADSSTTSAVYPKSTSRGRRASGIACGSIPTAIPPSTPGQYGNGASSWSNKGRKLSRRLARYYLAIALFQSPLVERSVTVSVSLRSPAVNVVALRRQVILSATLALRISRTAWLLSSDHLCPFALWTTFSSSPVSRNSHDYYGHSVSLEVALLRKSRVPSR